MSHHKQFRSLYQNKPRRAKSSVVDLDRVVEMAEQEAAARGLVDFDAQAAIVRVVMDRRVPADIRAGTAKAIERKLRHGDRGG
jgi:hypothetical protein